MRSRERGAMMLCAGILIPGPRLLSPLLGKFLAFPRGARMLLPGGALFRRHVREGRGKGNAWLPVRLLVVAALGNLGNRMLHLLLPSQPQVTIGR